MGPRERRAVLMREYVAGLMVVTLVGAALLAWWPPSPRVSAAPASSADSIQILEPTSFNGVWGGPVDTQVTLDLSLDPSQPQPRGYTLGVVTSPPSASACASATPVPGVGPIQLPDTQVSDESVTFKWPAALGKASYWFCAKPTNGSGTPLVSPPAEGFTVLSNSAPQIGVFDSPNSVQAGVPAGSEVQVIVSNWFTSDGLAPQLALTQPSPSGMAAMGISITSTNLSAPPGKPGMFVGDVELPTFVAPGNYSMTATGECGAVVPNPGLTCAVSETSAAFPILAAPTPLPTTAVPTVAPTVAAIAPGARTNNTDPIAYVLPILAVAGAAALILFAIFFNLVMRQRRRTRADALAPWRSWEGSPDESDHFRVEPLPKRPKR